MMAAWITGCIVGWYNHRYCDSTLRYWWLYQFPARWRSVLITEWLRLNHIGSSIQRAELASKILGGDWVGSTQVEHTHDGTVVAYIGSMELRLVKKHRPYVATLEFVTRHHPQTMSVSKWRCWLGKWFTRILMHRW